MPNPSRLPVLLTALAATSLAPPALAGDLPSVPTAGLPENSALRAVGDVNGDGAPDVVATNSSTIRVLLNDEFGGFAPGVDTASVLAASSRVRLADLTGDGLDDLVAYGVSTPLTVLPSLGDGSFGPASTLPGAPALLDAALGDVDADGLPDVVTVSGDAQFLVWRNLGGGSFAPAVSEATLGPAADVALTDIDGDDRLDVAVQLDCVGQGQCRTFMLHAALPAGGFAAPFEISDAQAAAGDTVLGADMNADGFGDLLFNTLDGWQLAFADGQGGLTVGDLVASPEFQFDDRHLADVNNDGLLDIHARDSQTSLFAPAWALLSQTPQGTFAETTRTILPFALELLPADVDSDGANDRLLAVDVTGPLPPLLITLSGDGDGRLRSAWDGAGPDQPIIVDLDGDGRNDVVDVGALRVALGQPGGVIGQLEPLNIDAEGAGWGRVADMDGDGETDVVTSTRPGISVKAAPLNVFRRTGPTGFLDAATPVLLAADEEQLGLELGDFDGDGDVDAVRYGGTDGVQTLLRTVLNDGTGQLADAFAVFDAPSFGINALHVGDLDADGELDVLIQAGTETSVRRSLNLGGGVLGPLGAAVPTPVGVSIFDSVLADSDADGLLDLHGSGLDGGEEVLVRFAGLGNGEFAAGTTTLDAGAILGPSFGVRAGDLDHDGDVDIVGFGDTVQFYVNDGTGAFTSQLALNVEGNFNTGNGGAIGDVDNDGAVDVIHNDPMGLILFGDGPWSSLGASLAGPAGFSNLSGGGPLTPGSLAEWRVEFAPANAPGLLVLGLSDLSAPFKGGTLVPFPDVLTPIATDADGELLILADWPTGGVPSGFQLWSQVWFVGGGVTPSATTALLATVP